MDLGITKRQRLMIFVLLSGTLLAVLNLTLLTPALPSIMADMGVNAETAQWLTSGYSLVEAVVIPLSAYVMGRFSTRRIFITGMSLFALGSLIAALTPSFWGILAGRMVQAACTGVLMPMVSSVILLIIPREKRGSAMGIIGLIIGFAPAIGPSLSGVLVDHVGWRAIFVIVTVLAALVAFVASRSLENFEGFERTRFDLLSVILSSVGLVSILYGFSVFGSAENMLEPIVLVVFGAIVIAAYAKRQFSLDEPMLELGILRTRQYRTTVVVIAIFQAGLIGMETIMPLYIQGVLGHSATVSGLTLLPGTAVGALVGLLAGRLFDRWGVRKPVLIGSAFLLCAAVGLSLLEFDSFILVVSASYALISIGIQFTMTPLNTWGVNSLPNESVRYAQSTSNTVNQVAGSFGIAVLVSVSALVSGMATDLQGVENTFAGYHAAFDCTAALLVVAVVVIALFVRNRAGEKPSGSPARSVPREGEVLARDAMNAEVASVGVEGTMGDVIGIMEKTGTSGVAVVDADGRLAGFVTDGDIARYLARSDFDLALAASHLSASHRDGDDVTARLRDLAALNVMKIAVKDVVCVGADMPLDQACRILSERKFKKVPVLENGRVVGSLSRRNIIHFAIGLLED